MAQTLLRFGEGSYGLRVDELVYKFRPDETSPSFQELTEHATLQSLAWYHASSVFPEALPALAVRFDRPTPHSKEESVEVEYDLSLFWEEAVVYDNAHKAKAHWKQAPSLVVTAWVENDTPVAKTPTDLRAAVQYAACTGKYEYITIDPLRKRERKHVSPTFFDTHVLPKLDGTVVLEERDGGILVFKANVPRAHETNIDFGKQYKCKIWKSGGQISACWYGH